MTAGELAALLQQCPPDLRVTVLCEAGELPLVPDLGPVVTIEGGGAAPAFVAINVQPC